MLARNGDAALMVACNDADMHYTSTEGTNVIHTDGVPTIASGASVSPGGIPTAALDRARAKLAPELAHEYHNANLRTWALRVADDLDRLAEVYANSRLTSLAGASSAAARTIREEYGL